jgi:tetratricopeptide (TPR) repeat protein
MGIRFQANWLYSEAYSIAKPLLDEEEKLTSADKLKLAAVLSRFGWWIWTIFEESGNPREGLSFATTTAEEILTAALRLAPRAPNIHYKLAMAMQRRLGKDAPEVFALLQKALELKPDFPEAILASDRSALTTEQRPKGKRFEDHLEKYSPELNGFSAVYPTPIYHIYVDGPDGKVVEVEHKRYYDDDADTCKMSFDPAKM